MDNFKENQSINRFSFYQRNLIIFPPYLVFHSIKIITFLRKKIKNKKRSDITFNSISDIFLWFWSYNLHFYLSLKFKCEDDFYLALSLTLVIIFKSTKWTNTQTTTFDFSYFSENLWFTFDFWCFSCLLLNKMNSSRYNYCFPLMQIEKCISRINNSFKNSY